MAPVLAAVAALACAAGLWAVLRGPSPCPVDLKVVGIKRVKIINNAGKEMCRVTLSISNRSSRGLAFDWRNMAITAKVGERWLKAPNVWTTSALGVGARTQGADDATLLLPGGTEACRIRLRYRYIPDKPRLPLGIRDEWARYEAPSRLSLKAQRLTSRLSPALYNWLWPPRSSGRTIPPVPHWRETTAEVTLPPPPPAAP